MKGYHEKTDTFWARLPDERIEVLSDGLTVQRNRIPEYIRLAIDEGFNEGVQVYVYWRDKNTLPFSGGWAEQPAIVWDVINLFADEEGKHIE